MTTKTKPRVTDPGRKTQRRTIETRERILQAAAEEFAEHGFSGASTRVVAGKARVQHPALTYHFKSKEGLWRAVMSDMNERYAIMYKTRLQGLRGVDASQTLRLIMEDFIRFSAANPQFHRLMSHEARRGGERMKWLTDHYAKPFFTLFTGLIRTAQREGHFIAGDPYHLAYLFIGAVTRVFMLAAEVKQVSGRSPHAERYVEEHVELCLNLFFRAELPRTAAHRTRFRSLPVVTR